MTAAVLTFSYCSLLKIAPNSQRVEMLLGYSNGFRRQVEVLVLNVRGLGLEGPIQLCLLCCLSCPHFGACRLLTREVPTSGQLTRRHQVRWRWLWPFLRLEQSCSNGWRWLAAA